MRRHKKIQEEAELDITSFMNLMIILVPVLLISMVFNHITVLELRLPLEEELQKQDLNPDDLSLEVIVRQTGFNVMLGPLPIESIDKKDNKFDLNRLSTVLQGMKKQLGRERTDIVILSEPDIDYQVLVGVIDTAKTFPAVVAASVVDAVLFPDVSLGDAPEVEAAL
ncbi:biopolymer transporter ExbD [Bermanella sp. WJH001]|uniref:biopolymer transporter ExbD n=1 Tax=Bermanella sp. WJH001 TaxID=3048005 RepID=UPI0024BEDF78|nr:biopolymer transporter ExbD [Bermanella sp. WJH001]MDJ1537667.1 biopolymer transporter ExbD [Bermanella sp. WJH001]